MQVYRTISVTPSKMKIDIEEEVLCRMGIVRLWPEMPGNRVYGILDWKNFLHVRGDTLLALPPDIALCALCAAFGRHSTINMNFLSHPCTIHSCPKIQNKCRYMEWKWICSYFTINILLSSHPFSHSAISWIRSCAPIGVGRGVGGCERPSFEKKS
jgi:hypothetical protein